jgi:hypothetical protein
MRLHRRRIDASLTIAESFRDRALLLARIKVDGTFA